MSLSRSRALLLGCALLVAAGCSSGPEREPDRPLPFHIGVLPVEVSALPGAQLASDEDAPAVAEDVHLSFDDTGVSAALVAALAKGGFVRVTDLHYLEGEREFLLAQPQSVQDGFWVQAADDGQMDLILAAVIRYHEGVRTHINSAFWLNLPLFLLGGPMTWFVNDRSYFVDVQLSAELFAVAPLVDGHATLEDQRSRLQQVRASAEEVPLDFLDRADHVGHYALSVLVPSGLLATESNSVGPELAQQLLTSLSEGLVRDIQAQSEQLVLADRMVDFFLRPEELRVVPTASGYELRGDVLLERGAGAAPSMKEAQLRWGESGDELIDFEQREVVAGDSRRSEYYRYPLVFHLPPGELPEFARLELVDGSSNEYRRTYLLPLRTLARPGS